MSALTERFDGIRDRINTALASSGRSKGEARLVAVSKWHPADVVFELAAYWGAKDLPIFGESYMQEARDKMPLVQEQMSSLEGVLSPEWHFIGHLQSKKAKDIAGRFTLIHSVDSAKLAQSLDKAWRTRVAEAPVSVDEQKPEPQRILVQVNVGKEPQKSGIDPDDLEALIQEIVGLKGISVQGLMCLPPLAEIGDASRPYFSMLRELRDSMEKKCGIHLPHLSMGMSDDFEAAIEEGATLVRVGTDIFGPRQ